MTILEVNPQFWGSWCWPLLLAGLFSGLASINTWGSSGVDGNDDFNQWLGLTWLGFCNQWWQPMMGLIGAGLLWYRWRNLLQRTWRFLDKTQFHFQFPFSGWDHWPGLRHGPSCTRWLGALTWPSWPMCGPWARFSRPGVCLKPPEMKPCVRWWPYRPGNLASKRNPRRIHFFS